MMKLINPATKPKPTAIKLNIMAFFELLIAPSLSPLFHLLSTWLELIIATTPIGRQHRTVVRIESQR